MSKISYLIIICHLANENDLVSANWCKSEACSMKKYVHFHTLYVNIWFYLLLEWSIFTSNFNQKIL